MDGAGDGAREEGRAVGVPPLLAESGARNCVLGVEL